MTNQRVVTFLNRDEVDFLDKLGKDALFSSGLKLSRAKIISWLIDFMKKLNIDGENIKSEDDLENRIIKNLANQPRKVKPDKEEGMKNALKLFLMSLVAVITVTGVCFAADSASIAVSCTIPEVPGLNAPLIEEKTARSESNEEINLAKADSASAVITTTYSR